MGCRVDAKGIMGTGALERLYRNSKCVLGFEGWVRSCQAEKVGAVFQPEEATMQGTEVWKTQNF